MEVCGAMPVTSSYPTTVALALNNRKPPDSLPSSVSQ